MNIFISYRRDDSIISAKLVHNELVARFGAEQVFMDIEGIGYGDDFVQTIDSHLESADVVLVVIGPSWVEMIEARLHGDDWVRHEVARALQLYADSGGGSNGRPRILPLLVDKCKEPSVTLPPDMVSLQRLNMFKFDERALKASVNTLVEAINRKTFEEKTIELEEEKKWSRTAWIAGPLIGILVFFAGLAGLFEKFGIDTMIGTATMAVANIGHTDEPAPWSGQVVLVAIDEQSLKSLGRAKFDSTWRMEHARFIQKAASAGARTVAFDVTFSSAGEDAAGDAALEQALRDTREKMPVVFGVDEMNGNEPVIHAKFAELARWGIACAGTKRNFAYAMPLAVQRDVQRDVIPPVPKTKPLEERVIVHPSLALAAFSGGGSVEPLDQVAQTLQVFLPRVKRSQFVNFFSDESVDQSQGGCGAVAEGDRIAMQLFDPSAIPGLRSAPQRLAYESVLAGDAQTLQALKDKIVLVGTQFAKTDKFSLGAGGDRWGVELFAQQIDALVRETAIQPLGAVAQLALMVMLGLTGAVVAFHLRKWQALRRNAVLLGIAILFAVLVVIWYRSEQQLIGLHYGVGALILGAWIVGILNRRKTT